MQNVIDAVSKILKNLKFAVYIKYLIKESISGIVIAAAVAAATLMVDNYTAIQEEGNKLSKVSIGLSEQYIESVLGVPIAKEYDDMSEVEIVYYKLDNSVTWCAYDEEDKVVAFVITTNTKRNMYKVKANSYMKEDAYLNDFSYSEFSDTIQNPIINPADDVNHAYYQEMYKGIWDEAHGSYFLIGTYQDRINDTPFDEIFDAIIGYQIEEVTEEQLNQMRSRMFPNTYGMIMQGYHIELGVYPMGISRVYDKVLYW